MINLSVLRAELRVAEWKELPRVLQDALKEKLVDQTYILYQKVMVNVTGAILQQKTGELAASIRAHTRTSQDPMVGWVGPEPADKKAWVHEVGGKGYYEIYPVKARMLHFFAKDGKEVFAYKVHHPPAEARRYLATALEEMDPTLGVADAVDKAFRTLK